MNSNSFGHPEKMVTRVSTLFQGFDAVNWKTTVNLDSTITFSYLSKNGEEGYPGQGFLNFL